MHSSVSTHPVLFDLFCFFSFLENLFLGKFLFYHDIKFFVIFGLTKYVSLASIVSAVALPITVYLTTRHIPLTILGIIIGLLVIIRHKENIKRLINGTESKLSFSKDKKDKK